LDVKRLMFGLWRRKKLTCKYTLATRKHVEGASFKSVTVDCCCIGKRNRFLCKENVAWAPPQAHTPNTPQAYSKPGVHLRRFLGPRFPAGFLGIRFIVSPTRGGDRVGDTQNARHRRILRIPNLFVLPRIPNHGLGIRG
jgi:hypothetical protein